MNKTQKEWNKEHKEFKQRVKWAILLFIFTLLFFISVFSIADFIIRRVW